MCLTSIDYSDGTHASYTYRTDNVPEHQGPPCPCSIRTLPLVSGCDDARYHGSMRRIAYEYQDQGPHGAILKERYWDGVAGHEGSGQMVSRIDPPAPSPLASDPNFDTMYTEYRGDGPTRRFTYTELHLSRPHNNENEGCPTITRGPAPQQFLTDYTDFRGNTTHLGYDTNWYVNSVRDANMHTTTRMLADRLRPLALVRSGRSRIPAAVTSTTPMTITAIMCIRQQRASESNHLHARFDYASDRAPCDPNRLSVGRKYSAVS